MANKARLTAGGAWSGSAGAVTGDHIDDSIVALEGGANDEFTPVLNADINIIKVCAAAGDSVKLPKGEAGDDLWLRNGGGSSLTVFPASNGRIDGAEIDAPVQLAAGKSKLFKSVGRADWITTS
jgi:hypothetical protein